MKIISASCSKLQQTNPQPVWNEILNEKPDVLLLLGDNIYLDHDKHSDPNQLRKELNRLYANQFAEKNFANLISDLKSRNAKLIAIYDDHDFLGNNRYGGEHDPALREAAREEFIKAFSPPVSGEDVYYKISTELVDIILLDERFYRLAPHTSRNDRDAILGEAQWQWFEDAVSSTENGKFLLIASSTTLHTFGDESWEQYPGAFGRMVNLLRDRVGAFIVSGDVHRNALYDDSGVIEIVTSGVARNGIVFGSPRKNYGVLTFSQNEMRVELRSLKAGWRFDTTISKNNWTL